MHVKDIELCLIFRHQQWLEQMLKSVRYSLTCRMYNTQFVIDLTQWTRHQQQQHGNMHNSCCTTPPVVTRVIYSYHSTLPLVFLIITTCLAKKKQYNANIVVVCWGVHGRLSNFIPLLATHLVGWVKSRKSRISCQHSIWTCCYGRPPENYSAARRGSIVSALHGLFELV